MTTTAYINGVKVTKEELGNIEIKSEKVKRIINKKLNSMDEGSINTETLIEKTESRKFHDETVEPFSDYIAEVFYCMDTLNELGQRKVTELAKKLTMIPEYRKDEPPQE